MLQLTHASTLRCPYTHQHSRAVPSPHNTLSCAALCLATGVEENRTQWQSRGDAGPSGADRGRDRDGDDEGRGRCQERERSRSPARAPPMPPLSGGSRRPPDDFAAEDDDMIPDEVKRRLAALKGGMS